METRPNCITRSVPLVSGIPVRHPSYHEYGSAEGSSLTTLDTSDRRMVLLAISLEDHIGKTKGPRLAAGYTGPRYEDALVVPEKRADQKKGETLQKATVLLIPYHGRPPLCLSPTLESAPSAAIFRAGERPFFFLSNPLTMEPPFPLTVPYSTAGVNLTYGSCTDKGTSNAIPLSTATLQKMRRLVGSTGRCHLTTVDRQRIRILYFDSQLRTTRRTRFARRVPSA